MNNNRVGYRFSPTTEELINFYLKNKILGKSWLVDDSITEIDIYRYDPMSLPSLSKIESNDHVWYFFSRNEYAYMKQISGRKRITPSGVWKLTGVSRTIKDKGGNGGEIGIAKTLVYHEGRVPKGVRTPWVMHEYHITCLPPAQRTYIICKITYKGEDRDFPSARNEVGNIPAAGSVVGNFPSAGSVAGNFPSVGNNSSDQCDSFLYDSSSVRASSSLTEMDKLQQKLPSVQTPVVDSNTVRAANFAKMYELLQNLPSVERHAKLDSDPHATAP